MVNDNFKEITSLQFVLSTGAVCFNLYRLSLLTYGPKFVDTLSYMLCLLLQIFYYCWYGNEVKLKVHFSRDIGHCSPYDYRVSPTAHVFLRRAWIR